MKKVLLIVFIMVLSATSVLLLSACGGTTIFAGSAWARTETLVYKMTEGDAEVGTLTVKTERLEKGSYPLQGFSERTFEISSASLKGIRCIQTATDTDGNEIMHSESLMNGFTSIASYKRVKYNDKDYEIKSYKDGKYYKYWIDGVEQKRINVKDGYVDNELMYVWPRAYAEIESGYSTSITIVDPFLGTAEGFSVVTGDSNKTFQLNLTEPDGTEKTESVKYVIAYFSKSQTPTGTSIEAWYTKDFALNGNADFVRNCSYRLPLKMIENNLTYTLISARAL